MGSLHTQSSQEYADESVNTHEKTGIACDRLRMELKRCIKESACVQLDRRPAAECIKAHDGRVPDRCFILLTSFSDCKRSMVDMRSRFRGRKGDL
uniref:Cytochrome c oxidase assembly factor 5 n=1 Tax=Panagrolaimus sp. ES5 TaxID=591445 RepID=A0AC34GRL0_9BILA